ncbi:MAG TPA: Dam family site-specific DNA-(adenine-N6)-methyltransferase, partial [Polyangiaceae bacterium]|nr:Dam family site-specific DNA-(adenine-N6)-methyltransferase [Polyangiaceae bacterium]
IDQTIAKHLAPKPGGTYHEPFVGGGAVFFHRLPTRAFLTDSNARLIRTYRGIQGDVERVIAQLRKFEKQHEKDFYLEVRAQNIDSSKKDADVAAWFIYLNRTGYNGLYRVNSKNGFNVPFGDYKKPMICDADNLRACAQALEGARIENTDFTAVAKRAKKGDFVYFDPPYIPLTATSRFTDYTSEGFSDAEQVKLRDVALELKARGVSVLLSNSSAPRVHDLYAKGFERREVLARRSVNSDPTGRGRIPELLIY